MVTNHTPAKHKPQVLSLERSPLSLCFHSFTPSADGNTVPSSRSLPNAIQRCCRVIGVLSSAHTQKAVNTWLLCLLQATAHFKANGKRHLVWHSNFCAYSGTRLHHLNKTNYCNISDSSSCQTLRKLNHAGKNVLILHGQCGHNCWQDGIA